MVAILSTAEPWPTSIGKASWRALFASWLGWMFDGYETWALVLVISPALWEVLLPEQLPKAPIYTGALLTVTLLGWAAGGITAGVLSDYIGRKRMLMLSILCYAIFAGLTALSWNFWSLLAFRFCTGIGLGAEWGPGAAIVAEFWPPVSRGRAAGTLHSAYGVGMLLASGIWLLLNPLGPSSWRYMFVIGILPAFVLLYLRRCVEEPALWVAANRERQEARRRLEIGDASPQDRELVQFTMTRIWFDPELRRRVGLLLLMSITTVVGWWSVSTWIPQYAAQLSAIAGQSQFSSSMAGLIFSIGSVVGLSHAGIIGRCPRSQANCVVVLLGRAGILVVPLSAGQWPGAVRYGCRKWLFQRRPIRVGDRLSAGVIPDARPRLGNMLGLQHFANCRRVRPTHRRLVGLFFWRHRNCSSDDLACLYRGVGSDAVCSAGDER